MWSDDPWAREQQDLARETERLSLANRFDDLVYRAVELSARSDLVGWEAHAAREARAEIDVLVQRLQALRAWVWSTVP